MKIVLMTWTVVGLSTVDGLALPDAAPMRTGIHWFCGVPGSACKERATDPEPRPLAARQSTVKGGFCGVPGEVCTTLQQSARAVRDALADHWTNYDAPKTGASALCNVPGGKCAIAREAIGDVSETAENAYHELIARKRNPRRHSLIYLGGGNTWFCGVPGMSCGRKRTIPALRKGNDGTEPRVVEALDNVDADLLRAQCAKHGNECHSLLNAQSAFHRAKREVEGVQGLADPKAKQAYCAVYGCDQDTEEYFSLLEARSPAVKKIENDCFAKDGECTLARRSLDALERTLNEAIAKIA